MKHLLSIKDMQKKDILDLLVFAKKIKANPQKYSQSLKGKSLLMFFEKPSLRTRVSFEVGMTQLGGHAVYYDSSTSPLGKGKETVEDTAATASRYVDMIMARVFDHLMLEKMTHVSHVPIINALSNFSHPCQILSDLLTIQEKKKSLDVKIAYLGDANNNVTHSLLFAASLLGFSLSIGCPADNVFQPQQAVINFVQSAAKKSHASIEITHDPRQAMKSADIIYTDSWMSYHILPEEKEKRFSILQPYQVTPALMRFAKSNALFMHCLPAARGEEVTAAVLDGKQSIVFDQAENRLHMQKAIMIWLVK